MPSAKLAIKSYLIQPFSVAGKWLHSRVIQKFTNSFSVSNVAQPKSIDRTTEEMKVKYFGDLASIEIFVPKYLGQWLEAQASFRRVSVRVMVKEWLVDIYKKHAQKATK